MVELTDSFTLTQENGITFYYALTLASHLNVLGTFGCRGKVKAKIVDEPLKEAEHKAWAEEALSAA